MLRINGVLAQGTASGLDAPAAAALPADRPIPQAYLDGCCQI
jgi:hypothetical protein